MKKNIISFLMALLFVTGIVCAQTTPAPAPDLYARVLYAKVEPGNDEAYLKFIHETAKPAIQQALQDGSIADWQLYRISFSGTNAEYNYASVFFFNSWGKTEKLPNLQQLLKKINPKADPAVAMAKLESLRKLVRQDLTKQIESTEGTPGSPPKYIMVSFMKPAQGEAENYVTIEKEIWRPLHQQLMQSGQTAGWSLWSLIFPSGSKLPYSYVTVNLFSDYAKINALNYEDAVKKAHPGRNVDLMLDQTVKSRDVVRSELWELVDSVR